MESCCFSAWPVTWRELAAGQGGQCLARAASQQRWFRCPKPELGTTPSETPSAVLVSAPVGASSFQRENGLMASLRCKGSLGRCLCSLVYHGSVFSIGSRLSTHAFQQHLTSPLCSYSSRRKVAMSRNLSLQEVAQGSTMPTALPFTVSLKWVLNSCQSWHEQAHFTELVEEPQT